MRNARRSLLLSNISSIHLTYTFEMCLERLTSIANKCFKCRRDTLLKMRNVQAAISHPVVDAMSHREIGCIDRLAYLASEEGWFAHPGGFIRILTTFGGGVAD